MQFMLRFQVDGLEGEEAIQKARVAVGNCIVAAVLLKTWLRELPDSIVPQVMLRQRVLPLWIDGLTFVYRSTMVVASSWLPSPTAARTASRCCSNPFHAQTFVP